MSTKKKKLKDIRVTELRKGLFAIKQPVYWFNVDGETLLVDLPHGSLIWMGRKIPGPAGFRLGLCGVWKGKEEINEYKKILIRNLKNDQPQEDQTDAEPGNKLTDVQP